MIPKQLLINADYLESMIMTYQISVLKTTKSSVVIHIRYLYITSFLGSVLLLYIATYYADHGTTMHPCQTLDLPLLVVHIHLDQDTSVVSVI